MLRALYFLPIAAILAGCAVAPKAAPADDSCTYGGGVFDLCQSGGD